MKYGQMFEFGEAALRAAGIPEASLNARLLLEWICKTGRHDLLAKKDQERSDKEFEEYKACIKRRKMREPLQHITGEQEFMGLTFSVNENVLIPRQDTEILVEEAMRYLHDGMDLLDLCTGSGCILLSLLHYSNDCRGTGVDLSEKALEKAQENAERLDVEAQFIQSNLFEAVRGSFDMIVSNPPYIRTEEIKGLMPEVRDFEPTMALDGSADGLSFYRRIVNQSRDFLRSGGYLFLEIGYDQSGDVMDMMKQAGYEEVSCVRDLAGLDRVVLGSYRRSALSSTDGRNDV